MIFQFEFIFPFTEFTWCLLLLLFYKFIGLPMVSHGQPVHLFIYFFNCCVKMGGAIEQGNRFQNWVTKKKQNP